MRYSPKSVDLTSYHGFPKLLVLVNTWVSWARLNSGPCVNPDCPTHRVSDSLNFQWSLIICISKKLWADADVAVPLTMLWESWIQDMWVRKSGIYSLPPIMIYKSTSFMIYLLEFYDPTWLISSCWCFLSQHSRKSPGLSSM